MKPLSQYVIWELVFQPRCSPIFSSSTTAFRVLTFRTDRAQGWGWGSISQGKLWSDMAGILTYRVVLGKEVFSLLCCHCTLILQQMISIPANLRNIPRQYGPYP